MRLNNLSWVNFNGSMNILSEHLTSKLIKISDIEFVRELHSFPEVDEFNTLGIPESIQETEQIIKPWILELQGPDIKAFTFCLRQSIDKKTIGLIALKLGNKKNKKAAVWHKLQPNFWNKGYGTEALNNILVFGFSQLKLHRIEAGSAIHNLTFIKILEKVGMKREGRKRKAMPLKTGWSFNYIYAFLKKNLNNEKIYLAPVIGSISRLFCRYV
jgi:ribosomal-protein-alanine N-acetyltransferase